MRRAERTSIFMRAMSTPVGQSRLQPLQLTQRSIAAATASEVSALGPSWPEEREPQRVGAAARQMHLVARDAEGRAHRAGVELPAVAVVVAHLGGLGEAAGRIAARAGRVSASVSGSFCTFHADQSSCGFSRDAGRNPA
jgi:hypothetical protein